MKLIMENWKNFLTEDNKKKKEQIAIYRKKLEKLIPEIEALKERCKAARANPSLESDSFEEIQCGDSETVQQYLKLSDEESHCLSQLSWPSPSGNPCRDWKPSLTNLQQKIVNREYKVIRIK